MNSGRIYPHFCMMARTLEEVGERWSLLIVRDLLLGPRRFTDLTESLGGITPTRLTERLRSLEAAGIVVREPAPTGREVWYRLTEAGQDLGPVLEELSVWAVEHAFDPPRRGEAVHPDHVMHVTRIWLERYGKRPSRAIAWAWEFADEGDYTLHIDGDRWALDRGRRKDAAVIVATTPEAWARFVTEPEGRRLPTDSIALIAKPAAAKSFARIFEAELEPEGVRAPSESK
jgi:DNA-binding HxlR family transcriptional regulator